MSEGSSPFVPFEIPEDDVRSVLYVDGSSPRASDAHPGTREAPLKTLGRAATLALEKKASGIGVRIVVRSGVYRESVVLAPPGFRQDAAPGELDTDAPLVIEAEEPGKAILEGADPWTGWHPDEGGRTWSHPWPYRWGQYPNPWAEMGIVHPPELGRRELVLVDGQPLKLVLREEELVPGTFTVSEEQGRLRICPPVGKSPEKSPIEVGVRAELLVVRGLRNVVVRGLVFQHAADRLHLWSAGFNKTRRTVFEDCTWRWNNWYGLLAYHCRDVVIRRCVANHNGGGGGLGFCRNLLVEDTETSSNNWRGASVNWFAWDTAAIKAMYIHGGVFRRHRALHNRTAALWIDTDTEDLAMEDCLWAHNLLGLSLENNQGPLRISRCVAAFNDIGLVIDKTENGLLEDSVVYGNRFGQIVLQGAPSSSFKNWETEQPVATRCQNWTWRNNVIVSTSDATAYGRVGPSQYWFPIACAPLVTMPHYAAMLQSLRSSRNLWHHPLPRAAFQYGGLAYGKEPVAGMNFLEWQAVTGQDYDSLFAEPHLRNPEGLDFVPRPGSPLERRDSWPRRTWKDIEQRLPELHPDVRAFAVAREQSRSRETAAEPPFPRAGQAPSTAWRLLDLAPVATRPLIGDEAWVNIPLSQLTPGRHVFRGVPFEILDQEINGGRAAVVLRSLAARTGPRGELPSEVTMPVEDLAQAIYVLHGAGWVTNHEEVARYDLIYEDGTSATLPIRVLGLPGDRGADMEAAMKVSNLQDFWPRHPQFSNEAARSVRLLGDGTPDSDRYLYVVEWVNPHPEKRIQSLRFSSDPSKSATVGVVAVTLLR